MVVPCLTCYNRDTYKYEYDTKNQIYNYYITCKCGIQIPQPVKKDGFFCEKYDCIRNHTSPAKRSEYAIEVKPSGDAV